MNSENKVYDKVAFIFGSGAVDSSWNPIVKTFESGFEFKIESKDTDLINLLFAKIVYQLRYFSSIDQDYTKEKRDELLMTTKDMKLEICKNLKEAQKRNTITVRNEFKGILKNFILPKNVLTYIISTNWDTVIDNAINDILGVGKFNDGTIIHINHIHGSINDPGTIYLPSEFIKEPYRPANEDEYLGRMHREALQKLKESNTSVLYGLSLSPLDAELCQLLNSGWVEGNTRKIIIIDPEHLGVSKRVKILTNKKGVEIIGYHPRKLDSPHDYSIY